MRFERCARGRATEVTASLRLEKLGIHNERPSADNSVRGRVVERIFLGSRVALDILVDEARDVTLKAYVDSATAENVGSDTVWIGWDIDSMAILRD